jgi:pimeloyl-ACP methyl ester carboxylesterase
LDLLIDAAASCNVIERHWFSKPRGKVACVAKQCLVREGVGLTEHRSITLRGADNVRLAGTLAGEGPPVLLLHGGGQTRHSWNRIIDRLVAAGYSALSIDLRGHGDSGWAPAGGYDLSDYRGDVRVVLSQLADPPAIVGASLGGVSAMLALGADPCGGVGLASCLVLVDVVPRMENAGVSRIRQFMRSAPDGFASLDDAAEAIAQYRSDRPRPRSLDGLAKNLRLHPDNRYRWHWDPNILDGFRGSESERHRILADAARGVAVPTLLVRGAQSDVVGDDGTRELAALIPHVEIAQIADAGHMVAGDSNDVFGDAIVHYVRENAPAAAKAGKSPCQARPDQ